MANATIKVKMKSKTGKGVAGHDKVWFNTGKGVNFDSISVGDTVALEYNGDSGVNFVSSYAKVGSTEQSAVPPVPSLPKTTVTETKAPGGEKPVAPANKAVPTSDPDKMSKQDWANKDKAIERIAIFKSVLEGSAYAQLTVGKRLDESLQVGSDMIDFFLNKLDGLR